MSNNLLKCLYSPFDDEHADLSFSFSPNAPAAEQVANLIFRFGEYRKLHKLISSTLNTLSADHYKHLDYPTLIALKQPVQVLVFAREALLKIDEALEKDINFCHKFLDKMKAKEDNGSPDTKEQAKKDS